MSFNSPLIIPHANNSYRHLHWPIEKSTHEFIQNKIHEGVKISFNDTFVRLFYYTLSVMCLYVICYQCLMMIRGKMYIHESFMYTKFNPHIGVPPPFIKKSYGRLLLLLISAKKKFSSTKNLHARSYLLMNFSGSLFALMLSLLSELIKLWIQNEIKSF